MESVLQKFQAMKEENMKFITDTQSKAQSCFSINNTIRRGFNYNNMNNIDIDKISNQIKEISSFIHQYNFFSINFKKSMETFFDYFFEKFTSIANEKFPLLSTEQICDINSLLLLTTQLINDNKTLLLGESSEEKSNILSQIKIDFSLLDLLLKVNFDDEKENLSKIRFYIDKTKNLVSLNKHNGVISHFDFFTKKISKIILVKENGNFSKVITKFYNTKIFSLFKTFRNYDIKFYFHVNESSENLKKYLSYIKKNIMIKYVMVLTKSKKEDYKCINVFGIGKSQHRVLLTLSKLVNDMIEYNSMIKYNIYENLEMLLRKKLTYAQFKESDPEKDQFRDSLHYNFDENYINQYIINN